MKKKHRITPAKLLGGSVVGIYALILLIPFLFVIITSFKTENELVVNPIGLPQHFGNDASITTAEGEVKEGAGAFKNANSTSYERLALEFSPRKDISAVENGALHLWLHIDDASKLEGDLKLSLQCENQNEYDDVKAQYDWTVYADNVQSGWNELILPFTRALRTGKADHTAVNSLRLNTSYGVNMTMIMDDISVVEYTETEEGVYQAEGASVSLWNCDKKNSSGVSVYTRPHNFLDAWKQGDLLNALKNSVIIAVTTTILVLINVILIAYCINRIRRFKISNVIYLFILASMFIPNVGNATLLTMRRQWFDGILYNSLLGEIVMGSLSITTGVFLVSGFLRTIPLDLEEAARIDGASDFHVCTKVIVPVIKPVLVTVGILHFTSTWNNAMGPMMTLRDPELYTIPLALLMRFSTMGSVENTKVFAGVILTAIPIVIVFIKCQKYFITAMAGSVKG